MFRWPCVWTDGLPRQDTPESIRLFFPNLALVAIALHCGGDFAWGGILDIDFSEDLITDTRTVTRDDGQITLSWESSHDSQVVELQQGSTDRFSDPVLRYVGADHGSVITGLPEGSHFFRIRALDADRQAGPWSKPFEVKVAYMERSQVIRLLIIGGLIVVSTVVAILAGHFRKGEEG